MGHKNFKMRFSAYTLPSGEIEEHTVIVMQAPSKEKVEHLFTTIMNADTSTLHEVIEVEDIDNSDIRVVNFPASMR